MDARLGTLVTLDVPRMAALTRKRMARAMLLLQRTAFAGSIFCCWQTSAMSRERREHGKAG